MRSREVSTFVLTRAAQAAHLADLPQPSTAFAFTAAGELRPGTLAVGGHRGRAPTSCECSESHGYSVQVCSHLDRYPWA